MIRVEEKGKKTETHSSAIHDARDFKGQVLLHLGNRCLQQLPLCRARSIRFLHEFEINCCQLIAQRLLRTMGSLSIEGTLNVAS